ncbi:MAG: hypothetical protein ACP5D7_22530 [Limnospira sp.]
MKFLPAIERSPPAKPIALLFLPDGGRSRTYREGEMGAIASWFGRMRVGRWRGVGGAIVRL